MKIQLSLNQVWILILSAATGLIHLLLLNILMGKVDLLFTLNGLGFLALAVAFLIPMPFLKPFRGWLRWIFIGYTLLTIAAWVAIGDKSLPGGLLGYFTKLVELCLVYVLWREK